MLGFNPSRCRALARDQRGSVLPMAAATVAGLAVMLFLLLDVTSIMSMRVKCRNMLDSAMLSLAAKKGGVDNMTQTEIITFLEQHIDDKTFPSGSYSITSASWDGIQGAAKCECYAEAPMLHAGLGQGAPDGTVAVEQDVAVKQEIRGLEAALVLDTTGSMASDGKIDALRVAAKDFVDIVFTSAGSSPELVKIAVVPFVASVNVKAGNGYFEANWVDSSDPSSVNFIDEAGLSTPNGKNFDPKTSHTVLYQLLSDVDAGKTYWYDSWRGCVETRKPPYDTLDTEPDDSDPESLWTPFFWPDEPDSWGYVNSWLPDFETTDGSGNPLSNAEIQASLAKYQDSGNLALANLDTTPTDTSGPNKSCSTPILPLTSTRADIDAAIDDLDPYGGGGTQVWQGVMWGFRAVSPEEPFPEGVPYSDTTVDKYLIVMSDGDNLISTTGWSNHNGTHYTGANYQLSNLDSGTTDLDQKMLDACQAAKNKGIEVVTIGFRVSSSAANYLRQCASSDALYYNVSQNDELKTTFQVIAKTIARLRMTQ